MWVKTNTSCKARIAEAGTKAQEVGMNAQEDLPVNQHYRKGLRNYRQAPHIHTGFTHALEMLQFEEHLAMFLPQHMILLRHFLFFFEQLSFIASPVCGCISLSHQLSLVSGQLTRVNIKALDLGCLSLADLTGIRGSLVQFSDSFIEGVELHLLIFVLRL